MHRRLWRQDRSRAVALIGSNITKSWPANSVLAGMPAVPKSGLSFYQDITLGEKWSKLDGWIRDGATELGLSVEVVGAHALVLRDGNTPGAVAFVRDAEAAAVLRTQGELTVCCVADKTYNKRVNATERRVLKYLANNKARFNAVA